MSLVEIALRRPYTFYVLALLLPILGAITLSGTTTREGMPADIFPDIRIPVIALIFDYAGMPPEQMSGRLTSQIERVATTVINDIEHVESQSFPGVAVIKLFFQPGVDLNLAMAQATAFSQRQIRAMPPGSQPPFILTYDASTVPIIQMAMSSDALGESQLSDIANQVIRAQIATIAGAAMPLPYGGASRQIRIDLQPDALRAQGLTASDINSALADQNLVVPAGTLKIGGTEYSVELNSSPERIEQLNDLPVRNHRGAITYLRDVAFAHDGHPPQTNVVRVNGRRAILMIIQKIGSASSLAIVDAVRARLPLVRELVPAGAAIAITGDQTIFVRSAIRGLLTEATIAAGLTALLVLLFLGSWRTTFIVTISIPLSMLASVIVLNLLGETINLMTLGGLALAVGILVDDATVTIENINQHLAQGKSVEQAILDGSAQITIPALVSTLSICIVFAPMFMLSGIARHLFVPMAEAVVFAMLTSYFLSRTVIPTIANAWLRPAEDAHTSGARFRTLTRLQEGFNRRFEAWRGAYSRMLRGALGQAGKTLVVFLLITLGSLCVIPFLGRDFFPDVDAGQIKLHVRGPTGMRVEETAALIDQVEAALRRVIPPGQISNMVDNIGLPISGINLAYGNSGTVGSSDADILITLGARHAPVRDYIRELRMRLPQEFPGSSFAFLPADMMSQILNFGAPAPIDIQVVGPSLKNRAIAARLLDSLRSVPGLVDLRIHQAFNLPVLAVETDRTRARELEITQRDVADNVLLMLSGSGQVAPTYWLNHETGLEYPLVAQAPQYRLSSLQDLQNLPVIGTGSAQILGGVAKVARRFGAATVSRYDAQPVIDLYAAVQGRDLGSVQHAISARIAAVSGDLPRGTRIFVRGQIQTMTSSYRDLLAGLAGAVVLIYLLIVVNYQSWLDPLVILAGLPAALAGIGWMLLATGTHLSVPALTGAIMCMGVATANSMLVVSFARERLGAGMNAPQAALEAAFSRFRPVLMTALAMIIGMLPTSLGLGDGGEQNAPLGRAVIGGLLFATVATLVFVPVVFCVLHRRSAAAPGAGRSCAPGAP